MEMSKSDDAVAKANTIKDVPDDPFKIFHSWFQEAKTFQEKQSVKFWNKMCLATSDAKGFPSCRMVLLKEYDERGFVFYTNYNSRKS